MTYEEAAEAVRTVHFEEPTRDVWTRCARCTFVWPCDVIVALDAADAVIVESKERYGALYRENETLGTMYSERNDEVVSSHADIKALRAENSQRGALLGEALSYTQHRDGCALVTSYQGHRPDPCSCGWSELETRIEASLLTPALSPPGETR